MTASELAYGAEDSYEDVVTDEDDDVNGTGRRSELSDLWAWIYRMFS